MRDPRWFHLSRAGFNVSVEFHASKLADAFVDERTHLVRQQLRLRVDHLHWRRLDFKIFQNIFEAAVLSVRRNHVGQEHAEAQTADARIHRAIDVIARNGATDWDRHVPATLPKLPLAPGHQADVPDAGVLTQVARLFGTFAAPPAVPAYLIAALRKGFQDTMQDPDYVAKLRQSQIQFNPMTGERLSEMVRNTIGAPKSIIERYKQAIE